MKSFYSSIFFLLVFTLNSLFAADLPEGISIYQSGKNLRIEFTLQDYGFEPTVVNSEEYLKLFVKGYGVTPEVGLPALPLLSFNIFVNDKETNPRFEIVNQSNSEEKLTHKLFPAQAPWEKIYHRDDRPFTINRNYYNSAGKEYPLIKISDPFITGGVKGVMVTIYPFNYNPAEDKLTVTTNAVIDITLNDVPYTSTVKSKDYNSFLKKIFINYDASVEKKLSKYLIITDPQFEAGLTSFINHKENFGFDVDLFTTATTGTSNTAIKNFIQGRYNDPQTKPEYVLLVGDVQHIPAWVGSGAGSPYTDMNYVLLEGSDYYADAFIGRFSVTNAQQLANAINKSIFMESNIATLNKKNVFMSSTDNYSITEGTHNYVINTWFEPEGYTNLKLYTYTYNATTTQLINALNDNQLFAIYSGHGGETSWADGPPLSQSQVQSLTNSVYPFVYSFACVTGSYHIAECFGETWLRTSNGGSTFYGSSVNSYWDEDDILERRLFKAMFDDEITRVTPMFDMAKIYLANHYGSITSTILRYFEMYNLMGDPSMPTVRQIPPDTTPPDPVTDLTIVNPESNRLTLNWTAPYDSTFGGVISYDIRYSTTMINNDYDFNNAPQVMFGGQSDTAGTPKSFTLTGLEFNTTYYLAIKALDMWNNKSPISNVAQGLTLAPPSVLVTPDSLHCIIKPDTLENRVITLSNISQQSSTLDYSIELTNNTFPDNVRLVIKPAADENISTYINKNKEPVFKGSAIKGSGGPDEFGYEWIDSDEPGGPEYIWQDISTTGAEITNWLPTGTYDPRDEGYAGPLPIGFDFKFYGNIKNELFVSSNGVITFSQINSNIYSNTSIPSSGTPNDFIAPFWDDLEGSTTGKVYYKQDGNRFIIQFNNWRKYYSTSSSLTFQVVLHSSGKILIYYNNMAGDLSSSTIGIENGDGSIGLQTAYNSSYIHNEMALQFSAEPDWLAVEPLTGTIHSGSSAEISLMIDTDGLEEGYYSMDMEITTNDPENPLKVVPVSMLVTIIPVELSSFTAENISGSVILKWSTASETNNYGFEIERRNYNKKDWEKIGFVEGKGTTTTNNSYLFKDDSKDLKTGKYLYRLKQIDFDGTYKYSNETEVNINIPYEFSLEQNYPNPFNPSTIIKFSLPVESNVKIVIYNSLGESVTTLLNSKLEAGYHEVEFNASGLATGIYYYRMETSEFSSIKKMLLLK